VHSCTAAYDIAQLTHGWQGTLREHLRNAIKDVVDSEMALPLITRMDYMLQIVSALKFLHQNGVSHEALAAKKIMIADGHIVKLAMLGRRGGNVLFKPFEEGRERSSSTGSHESIELLSPDMVTASALFDEDVMAWMVGPCSFNAFKRFIND